MRTLVVVAAVILLVGLITLNVDVLFSRTPRSFVEIMYTERGYEPKEVHVRRGDSVRWVNRSAQDMWPASAVHPTHALYPEKSSDDCLGSSFDACRPLPPGSSYEYTFDHVGTWKFHDHIRASHTGVVTVTE